MCAMRTLLTALCGFATLVAGPMTIGARSQEATDYPNKVLPEMKCSGCWLNPDPGAESACLTIRTAAVSTPYRSLTTFLSQTPLRVSARIQ